MAVSFVLACGSTWCRGGRELVTAAFHVLLAVPAAVGGPRKRGPGADESKSESFEVSEEEEVYIGTFFFAGVWMAGGGDVNPLFLCSLPLPRTSGDCRGGVLCGLRLLSLGRGWNLASLKLLLRRRLDGPP